MSASTVNYISDEPQDVIVRSQSSYEGPLQYVRETLEFIVLEEMHKFNVDEGHGSAEGLQASKFDSVNAILADILDKFMETVAHTVSNDTISFDDMTLSEIVEQLKCRCKEIKSTAEAESTDTDDDALWTRTTDTESLVFDELAKSHDSLHMIECKDLRQFSVDFVDAIVAEAETMCVRSTGADGARDEWLPGDNVAYIFQHSATQWMYSSSESGEEAYSSHEIPRVTIADFEPDSGRSLIHQFVTSWRLANDWKFWIEYTACRMDVCYEFHDFEVKWSLPTNQYPVPQVTVLVLFTIKISRLSPPTCPVKVDYRFEGSGVQFKMTDRIDHEQHLNDLLAHKQKFCSQRYF